MIAADIIKETEIFIEKSKIDGANWLSSILPLKSLRNLSFSKSYFDRYNHDDIGWNYRMTNLQAALGCGQLKNIKTIIKRKREIGNLYYKYLKYNKKILLQENSNS